MHEYRALNATHAAVRLLTRQFCCRPVNYMEYMGRI
jgi:hypothetical protein